MKAPRVTVVVPVYNEAQNVVPLLERLQAVLDAITSDYQVLFVNDGSADETALQVRDAARRDPRIELLSLSRNFGHQSALTAGLDHARGEVVISMDGDLQHPPELIPQMLALHDEGADIVYTVRQSTRGESAYKRFTSSLFYRTFNRLSPVRILEASSDFRLMGQRAVEALRRMPERHRFLRGMIPWTGLRSAVLPYEAHARHAGEPKYSTWRMLSMALDAAFSFSRAPLQLATVLGLLITMACFAYFTISVVVWWRGGVVPGWTSLIASVLFIGGVQLTFVGLLGEYVGRIYEEVKGRPLYVVQEHYQAEAASATREHSPAPEPSGAATDSVSRKKER